MTFLKLTPKIFFIFIGLLIGIILIECGLNVAGWIYEAYRMKDELSYKKEKDTFRILCVGDSYTFGVGAPRDFSYPEQLENMLVKEFGNQIKVINEGKPGWNSSQILKKLPSQIKNYNPNMVILLIGMNDSTNFTESNYYFLASNRLERFVYRFDSLLMNLKSYKLLKTVWENLIFTIKLKIFESNINYRRIHKRKKSLSKNEKKKIENLWNSIKQTEGDKEKKEKILKNILRINPYDSLAHETLWKDVYWPANNIKEALKHIEIYPYFDPEREKLKKMLIKGLPSYINGDIVYDKLFKPNLIKIFNIIKDEDIKLILQNYPQGNGELNLVIEDISSFYKIPLVDNHNKFKKLKKELNYKLAIYFNLFPDRHPKRRSYKIMAKNIFKVIKPIMED